VWKRKTDATREAPSRGQAQDQPEAREGQAGRDGVAERPVVPLKSGNADGGKGPQFKTNARSGKGQEIGKPTHTPEMLRDGGKRYMPKRRKNSGSEDQMLGKLAVLVRQGINPCVCWVRQWLCQVLGKEVA